jgi:nitroreductase
VTDSEALFSIIRERRSVRKFEARPVPKETIVRLIEAAGWAPSAGNRQDWFFTAVTSGSVKRQMAQAVRSRWKTIIEQNRDLGVIGEIENYASHFADFEHAPCVIVVSAARTSAVQQHLLGSNADAASGSSASAAMAAQNIMLSAHALGLGSCCMTGALAAHNQLTSLIGLDTRQQIVCLIAIGYPDESPQAPKRKPVGRITRSIE